MDISSAHEALASCERLDLKIPYLNELRDIALGATLTPQYFSALKDALHNNISWECCSISTLLLSDLLHREATSDEVYAVALEEVKTLLEHNEPRVRQTATKLVHSLIATHKLSAFHVLHPYILSRTTEHNTRLRTTRDVILGREKELELDDTTGWRALETYHIAYREVISALGADLNVELMDTLFDSSVYDIYISGAAKHINRHIRQVCFTTIPIFHHYPPLSHPLTTSMISAFASGLQDAWCQVRLAAATALAHMITHYSEADRVAFITPFIPQLCMNRYYPTESIRTVSLTGWKEAVGSNGKNLVAEHLHAILSYYYTMTQHANHMIVEAAIFSITELPRKLPRDVMLAHVEAILAVFQRCVADASWPIRETTQLSLGSFISHTYAYASYDESLLWILDGLLDSIKAVRLAVLTAVSELLEKTSMTSDEKGRNLYNHILEYAKAFISQHILAVTTPKKVYFIPPALLASMTSKTSENKESIPYRRPGGWGCCLDCTVEKERTRADESEIAVSLMRVIAGYCYRDLLGTYEDVLRLLMVDEEGSDRLQVSVLQELPSIMKYIGRGVVLKNLEALLNGLDRMLLSTASTTRIAAEDCLFAVQDICGVQSIINKMRGMHCLEKYEKYIKDVQPQAPVSCSTSNLINI